MIFPPPFENKKALSPEPSFFLFTAEPPWFLFFLLSVDPRGIGFAFHRAGRTESKTNQLYDRCKLLKYQILSMINKINFVNKPKPTYRMKKTFAALR
ncbi:hypothetical protein C6A37_06830 [Desulfobacteraceae bacterium SEEP-SAG9]|nr:hypothetical protein C6A37_06830 [Desulfobacteraceae bacterium SEEP-SAG9]